MNPRASLVSLLLLLIRIRLAGPSFSPNVNNTNEFWNEIVHDERNRQFFAPSPLSRPLDFSDISVADITLAKSASMASALHSTARSATRR